MNLKRYAAAFLAAACVLFAGFPVCAADSRPNSDYLTVTGYSFYKSATGKPMERVKKDDRITVEATVKQSQLTTDQAGKIRVSASSESFRIGKDSKVSAEVTSNGQEPLALKLLFSDIIYKGTGDTLRFKLSYSGSTQPDYGTVRIFECVEYQKPQKENNGKDEDGKPKKTTHYGAPVILITRQEFDRPVQPGETFQLTVRLQNTSTQLSAANLIATFEPSEGLTLLESGASQYLRTLRPRKTEELTVRLRANKELQSPSQQLGVSLKYDYVENDERASSTAAERLPIPFDESVTGKSGMPTPNLIVSRYDYGKKVAVGDSFDLALEFRNTSPDTPVENIVLSLDTSDGLSISDGSNTFYFPALAAGGTLSQTVHVQAIPQEKQESPKIDLAFKYEYLDGAKRVPATASEKIAIPVVQPDRFLVAQPSLPEAVVQGEEATVSLPYVNKGKGQVYNVEAEMEGTNMSLLEAHQNLGNFEAGKSGTIDFIITPQEPGEVTGKITVSYEDANMKVQKLTFPLALQVSEALPQEDMTEQPEDIPAGPPAGWIFWTLGGFGVLLSAGLLIRRAHQKKRRAEAQLESFTWEPEDDTQLTAGERDGKDETQ